jgi:hypothetical protein
MQQSPNYCMISKDHMKIDDRSRGAVALDLAKVGHQQQNQTLPPSVLNTTVVVKRSHNNRTRRVLARRSTHPFLC